MSDQLETPQEHYFSAQPQAASRPREIVIAARGLSLKLQTDRGVFAHGGLDKGTKLLAEKMEMRPGTDVLDWGAGYGPLGLIAATVCPDCRVTMVEINERAAALAEQNTESLGLKSAVVICGEAPDALDGRDFDTIVSNPPFSAGKGAVEAIIHYAVEHLRPGGELWLVIPTNKGAKSFMKQLNTLFPRTETKAISAGYRILWAAKEAASGSSER
jgi:16S rRNA (guanine1207-N2)-methyltransferase